MAHAPEWDAPEDAFGGEVVEVGRGAVALADLPDEVAAEERALVSIAPQTMQHHIVTGMGMLARMEDGEFQRAMEAIERGQRRLREFQQRAMNEGEDYGKVKGIERPFLHLPGAEKLLLLYGLAARQEAERIVGKRDEEGNWLDAPLAYHVKTYIHVGSFDGPIVAMGYGEASVWEEKYRYRNAKAKCPNCGREGLIRGRADGPLKGQWWCPGKEGGCNGKFAPGTIPPPGKVENTEYHSLAETVLQMAAKRSVVAAVRRATGTSGLFTQDDDSPSVRDQSDASGGTGGDNSPQVTDGPAGIVVKPGAKTDTPTKEQLDRLVRTAKDRGLAPPRLSAVIERLFGVQVAPTSKGVSDAVKGLTATQVGQMLQTIETGAVETSDDAEIAS